MTLTRVKSPWDSSPMLLVVSLILKNLVVDNIKCYGTPFFLLTVHKTNLIYVIKH